MISNLQNIISNPTSRSINDVFNTINTDINLLYNTATTNVSFINTVSDFPSGIVVAGIVPPVIKLVDNKKANTEIGWELIKNYDYM